MPPRPVTDSTQQVAAFVAELAACSRGQPVSSAQVARILQTNQSLRERYDDYHATWSRLDLSLAHSELSVTDALRRLEGYVNADHSVRRLQERPNGRVHWIFAPTDTAGEQRRARVQRVENLIVKLDRITAALEAIATALASVTQNHDEQTEKTP